MVKSEEATRENFAGKSDAGKVMKLATKKIDKNNRQGKSTSIKLKKIDQHNQQGKSARNFKSTKSDRERKGGGLLVG